MGRLWRRLDHLHVLCLCIIAALLWYISTGMTYVQLVGVGVEPAVRSAGGGVRAEPAGRHSLVSYEVQVPLIWVGGVPRSGTTLARAMLDAHPLVRCGEETRVIPRILGMHTKMLASASERARLLEAKVDEPLLDAALASYVLTVIAGHGEPAPRLCNKDPFALRSARQLLRSFPHSRFVLMVRDGRATAHSIISRKVTIRGFDTSSYRSTLAAWNKSFAGMLEECRAVGPKYCMPVYYERLVLEPRRQMERLLRFLEVPWNDAVLHHEEAIGKPGGISLSKKELSTDQVDKPVNAGALTKWLEALPEDVARDIDTIAPMLRKVGYDTSFPVKANMNYSSALQPTLELD